MADAVNRAIAHRTTEDFYVWLGDDDVLLPQGIVALVESLVRAPDAVVAFGRCDYVNDAGAVIVTSRAGSLARWLLPWGPNFIPHPGTVIRLQALEKVGGFDPRLLYALDLDVFLKLRRIGNFVTLSVTASQFRWHAESLTVADRWASSKEAMRVKRSHLPLWLRPFSPLWHWPVAGASALAAKRVSRLSAQLR
jgi:GT2 family glycosyltransferase